MYLKVRLKSLRKNYAGYSKPNKIEQNIVKEALYGFLLLLKQPMMGAWVMKIVLKKVT